jgi:hypothetical protein
MGCSSAAVLLAVANCDTGGLNSQVTMWPARPLGYMPVLQCGQFTLATADLLVDG